MKLYLDNANLDEIREVAGWGILDGVTTNPFLVSREKGAFEDLVREICAAVSGPVSAEAVAVRAEDIVPEARRLAGLAPNVVVKIPVGVEGLKATRALAAERIAVNMTLVFSAGQALLAAKAGARYVSPFVGRLDDVSEDGMALVEEIVAVFANYDFATEVIVASVRHPRHVLEAARLGADIATVPYAVLQKLVRHPLTDKGVERFLDDWRKVKG